MAAFRARFSPLYPVTLRRCKVPDGTWGDTGIAQVKGQPRIQIRVSKDLDDAAALCVVVHELAHAITWRHDGAELLRESDHDAEWGVAFARLWRELVDG